jgi:hypothetical protein
MTKIQITAEIQSNMNTTLDTLRQIVDKNGYFEFDSLRATGLKRVEVMQAITFLNDEGQDIRQNRTRHAGGFSTYSWCWNNIHTNSLKAAHEVSKEC